MTDDKNRNTIQQYTGDMVALESHIEEAIDRQKAQMDGFPEAAAALQRFHAMVRSQRDELRNHLKNIGGSESRPVKEAVASAFGLAAGFIDKIRTEAVSKALRDDYTAFNHAAIGYSMLHATAHFLDYVTTAEIAERHLRAYSRAAQEINQLIAGVVAAELRNDGQTIDEQAVQHATDTINRAWRETSVHGQTTQRAA